MQSECVKTGEKMQREDAERKKGGVKVSTLRALENAIQRNANPERHSFSRNGVHLRKERELCT